MGELFFIGLGLVDERCISLAGLETARRSDHVMAEFYTGVMSGLSQARLEQVIGRPVIRLSRRDVEEHAESMILQPASTESVAFLVPGDPMVATTHIDLRLRALKKGIRTGIIHAASISSAIPGAVGLQSYKFGRTVTIPIPEADSIDETPYNAIKQNHDVGLHSLLLLDIRVEENRFLSIAAALEILLKTETRRQAGIVTPSSLVVAAARIGSENSIVKAGTVDTLMRHEYGSPPFSLVFPGRLHFMEAEALKLIAGADEELLRKHS